MTRVALSYRRDDSAAITGRIFDRLTAHYGGDSVFRDIDNIPLGVDFREYIDKALGQTDIVLVVVGPRWFGARRGRRRIDDPADPVRVEVETALRSGMPVVPVLVEGAGMPNVDQLPDSLKEFVYRNGLEVDSGRDFDQHIERLIRNIQPILARRAQEQAEAAQPVSEERQRAEVAQQVEEEQRRAEAAHRAGKQRRVGVVRQVTKQRPEDDQEFNGGLYDQISQRDRPIQVAGPDVKIRTLRRLRRRWLMVAISVLIAVTVAGGYSLYTMQRAAEAVRKAAVGAGNAGAAIGAAADVAPKTPEYPPKDSGSSQIASDTGDHTGTYVGTYKATHAPGPNLIAARIQQSGAQLTAKFQTSTGVNGSGAGTISGNVATLSWENTAPCPGKFHGTFRFSEDVVTFTGEGNDCAGAEQIEGQAKLQR